MTLPANGTERLVIRLLERRDLEEVRCLHNHDETLLRLTDAWHVSETQQEGWFQAVSSSRTSSKGSRRTCESLPTASRTPASR